MTQTQLTAHLQRRYGVRIARSALSEWETRNRVPSSQGGAHIVAIANLFGVTTDYLLGVSNERETWTCHAPTSE
jgi:transcriptional regulator with XRE-family HTH domain